MCKKPDFLHWAPQHNMNAETIKYTINCIDYILLCEGVFLKFIKGNRY